MPMMNSNMMTSNAPPIGDNDANFQLKSQIDQIDTDRPLRTQADHQVGDYEMAQMNSKPKETPHIVREPSPPGPLTKTDEQQSSYMKRSAGVFIFLECLAIVFFGCFVEYAPSVSPTGPQGDTLGSMYAMFQDVHVMIFVGFGFLMTFLRYHMWSSVMFNFLVSAWCIQWGIFCVAFWHHVFDNHWSAMQVNIGMLIEGDFAAACVLISFGAVLGKVNGLQLMIMATIELLFYGFNVGLGQKKLKAVDMGGSMYVHAFGSFFGVACTWALGPKKVAEKGKSGGAGYVSSTFAAIGTLFLWMFWPAFNAALATNNAQHRAVANTVLALTSSTMGTFIVSALSNHGKFKMEDCLNATLAGGVMIGSSADLVTTPWVALLIGFGAGILSTVGFEKLNGWLYEKLGIHDTCGVNNLHGMPGFIGGFIGALCAANATYDTYGNSLITIWPEMDGTRTARNQAGHQFACLFCTVGISLLGGAITGAIIKCPWFMGPTAEQAFEDGQHWEFDESEIPLDKLIEKKNA